MLSSGLMLIRQYGTKVVATATVKGVKGKRLLPTRAALTLVGISLLIKNELNLNDNCNFRLHQL